VYSSSVVKTGLDVGLVGLSEKAVREVVDIGEVVSYAVPSKDSLVRNYGRTTELSSGRLLYRDVTVVIDYGSKLGHVRLKGLDIYSPGCHRSNKKKELIKFIKEATKKYSPEDCAASVQKFAEYAILNIMTEARKYGSKLVYSGGCAQNVVVNSKIFEMFDEVHIAIAPTDSGSALGAAAKTWAEKTGGTHLKWNPYLGYDIQREINPREIVDHILKYKVCGIANGRAEFGPRALGNRSLIADVRYDVKDTVNEIKRRHKYRPFAPAVLAEHANKYFSGPMNEYMQYTSKALHDYSSVTHVDGTARVQLLQPDCPSIFRKIVEEYYERTGVPMLLNTSLNIRGRPIVNDELDARLWENKYKVKVF